MPSRRRLTGGSSTVGPIAVSCPDEGVTPSPAVPGSGSPSGRKRRPPPWEWTDDDRQDLWRALTDPDYDVASAESQELTARLQTKLEAEHRHEAGRPEREERAQGLLPWVRFSPAELVVIDTFARAGRDQPS